MWSTSGSNDKSGSIDRERLADAMARAGFESGRRTFFVWEGVIEYERTVLARVVGGGR